jgi:multiple sugar transport system permease protein
MANSNLLSSPKIHLSHSQIEFSTRGIWGQRSRTVIYLAPALVAISIFLLWPLLQVIGLSFTNWDGYGSIRFVGLATWRSLVHDAAFQAALRHSLLWLLLAASVPPTLGFVLAVILSRTGTTLRAAIRAIVIVPLLLPPAVAAVTWGIIYNPLYGPLNSSLDALHLHLLALDWLGDPHVAFWALFVVSIWSTVGFSVLVFLAALSAIDRAYFDLARVEGASFWWELRAIMLPTSRRAAALAVVVTIVLASQVFDLLFILTNGGPGNATIMLPLDMYDRAFGGGNVSAGAAVATVQVALGIVLATIAFIGSRGDEGMAGEGEFVSSTGLLWRGFWQRSIAAALSALAGIVVLLPLVWDGIAAFTTGRAVALQPLSSAWRSPTVSAFVTAWRDGMGSGLWQSAVIASAVVILAILLAIPAAYGLAVLPLRRVVRGVVLAVLVLTLLQPGEASLIPLFYLLGQLGLLDTATGLVLVEAVRELPFAILLLWGFMRVLPADVLAAAEIEAGRGLRSLWHIILPLSRPALAAVALWVFVTSWSEYLLPTVLLSNSPLQTAPMALVTFAGRHDTQFNLLAAGTLLLILPVLLFLTITYAPTARGLRAVRRGL